MIRVDGGNELCELLTRADQLAERGRLDVAVPFFDTDSGLWRRLVAAAQSGSRVRLLTRPAADDFQSQLFRELSGLGVWVSGSGCRLSSLCSFRTLYFTPESGPATEGFSCRGAVMNDKGNAARKIRKLRASRDLWKQRSAEKQQEIRQLRVTVRDLSSSRENWKTRVKELEQQLQAAHEAHAAVGPGSWIFFGGLMDNIVDPKRWTTQAICIC